MRKLILSLSVLIVLLAGVDIRAQDETLPDAPWYSVIHQTNDDTLHWVNASGEQAARPRPQLPNAVPGEAPRLRLSPDGQTLVIAAPLVDGREGLGFYDLEAGRFLATHSAQSGERVIFGLEDSAHGNTIAIGFSTPETGAWRVIVFSLEDGSAVHRLRSDDPVAIVAPTGRAPQVVYYDGESVQIHLREETSARGQTDAAFTWSPAEDALMPSDTTDSAGDFMYSTGERAFTFTDRRFDPAPGEGDVPNAVGSGPAANPLTLDAGGTLAKEAPRWANGGRWLAYRGINAGGSASWYVAVVTQGGAAPTRTPRRVALPDDVQTVIGTPDGLLSVTDDGQVRYVASLDATAGTEVFQAADDAAIDVLYVTPETVDFAVESVAMPAPQATTAPNQTAAPTQPTVRCPRSPASRLAAGDTAQVIGNVPLRVRDAPGGSYVTEMPVGSRVALLGGPQCVNDLLWWRVRWEQSLGEVVEGWSAEGQGSNYYLESVTPTATPPPTATPSRTPTPTLSSGFPFAPPTVTPTGSP